MSFKSVLKTIGGLFMRVEPTVESLTKILLPASAGVWAVVDPLIARVQASIVTVEAAKPIGTPGNIASDAVIADFNAALNIAEGIAEADGKVVVFDGLALQTGINSFVSGYNSMAVVKASLKIVSKDAVPAGMTVAGTGVLASVPVTA